MNTFANLETYYTDKLNSLLATHMAIFSSKVIALFQLGTPLLVLYYGYSMMSSRGSNASLPDMIFNLVRIGMVFAFVRNSGGLLDLSIGFIHELKSGFMGSTSLFSLLDELFETTQQLSQTIFKIDTSWFKSLGAIASLMVWLGTIFILASSAIIFIAAEVGLALLTVTSPIFVGCLTYSFTRELFNGWLRSIFSCIITLIFATLIVKIGLDINKQAILQLSSNPQDHSILSIGATAFGLGIIVSSLVFVSTKIAGNIAGVAATAAIQGGMRMAAAGGQNTAGAVQGGGVWAAAKGYNVTKSLVQGGVAWAAARFAGGAASTQSKEDSNTLKSASQKASLARVRQTNSQN